MPALKHTHTMSRMTPRGTKPPDQEKWKCLDPVCTYTATMEFLKGKLSLCCNCRKKEIMLDSERLQRKFPKCENCSERKKDKEKMVVANRLQELGIL